ncbi:hypothetical protein GGR51DRAFT_567513 [Nemania sp. FL0031]|nr:hypothetical protein GGR51DRAFT_567513 [Nemania sp. FL0031]
MAELAFIGLAGNILQFLQMGIRLAANARELYRSRSGTTAINAQFEADTEELKSLMEQLRSPSSSPGQTKAEKQLSKSVKYCIEASDTLLGVLGELKVKNGRTSKFAEVAKRTLFNESKRDKIIQLHKRLCDLEDSVMFRIVIALREDQSTISKALRSLGDNNRRLEANTTQKLDLIHHNLRMVFDKIPSDPLDKLLDDPSEVASVVQKIRSAWPKDLRLNLISEEIMNAQKQQKFLKSLLFPEIKARYQSIKESHPETFSWMLDDEGPKFLRWLEEGEGTYWIRGKAGSGKSTLMRFLVERKEVTESLRTWADGRVLVTASHFFWHAGSPIQKSREGLFRTLLFQILRQIPDLIKSLFSSRWNSPHGDLDPWSERELLQALEQLPLEPGLPFRFCFFIDGLDEYTAGAKRYYGEFRELIEVFEVLSASSVIKVCVSSRPWTAFDRAFKENPNQLRLEDLTKDDIEKYVLSKFRTSEHFQVLATADSRCKTLSKSVVQKAQGVFLWVHLVVDSLIRGASAEDSFDDLQVRLNEIPEGLDEYFEHMLRTIEPVYLKDTLCIFRFTVDADQPLPILAYYFLDRFLSHHTTNLTSAPCSKNYTSEIKKTEIRLNARCKDLLEVVNHPDRLSFMSSRIDFLHRTVRDFFLENSFLDDMMRERGIKFDGLMSISRVMLALIKTLDRSSFSYTRMMSRFSGSLMHYVHRIEQEIVNSQTEESERLDTAHALLDELDDFTSQVQIWLNYTETPGLRYRKRTFLTSAIEGNLLIYVTRKLDADPKLIKNKQGWPLLDYALRPETMTLAQSTAVRQGPYLPLVKLLLSKGADPNEEIHTEGRKSPWFLFLIMCRKYRTAESTQLADLYEAMKLMISHGADFEHPYFLNWGGFPEIGLSGLQIQSLREAYKMKKAESSWITWLSGRLPKAKFR